MSLLLDKLRVCFKVLWVALMAVMLCAFAIPYIIKSGIIAKQVTVMTCEFVSGVCLVIVSRIVHRKYKLRHIVKLIVDNTRNNLKHSWYYM